MIAGLPKAPGETTPFRHPQKALNRQIYVLEQMLENGFITRREFDTARAEELSYAGRGYLLLDKPPYSTPIGADFKFVILPPHGNASACPP